MDLLRDLNDEQMQAVTYEGKYLLVIAGAGSGKTRVLTRRIAYLLQHKKAFSNNILAITFTNKAANEMRDRIMNLLGTDVNQMWICTFHSMCVKILRAESRALGISSNFSIYDTQDVKKIINNIYKSEKISTKIFPIKDTIRQISYWKNNLISPNEAKNENTFNVIAEIYEEYDKQLKMSNAFDFDDLLTETVCLFQKFPEILEKYRHRFRHVLVDEYQDTNYVQYLLVKYIAEKNIIEEKIQDCNQDFVKDSDQNYSLTAVGDSDQSIYAFRGATVRNIDEFEKDFPEAKIILLEKNYRSTGIILDVANSVISQNKDRREKVLRSTKGRGDKVTVYTANSEYSEAHFIADKIKQLVADNKYNYSDIAIFYRTNSQSGPIEIELTKSNVPCNMLGGTKFYDRKEIKDALCYLQLISNPNDINSFLRVVNEPKRGIGVKTRQQIIDLAHSNNVGISEILDSIFGYSLKEYGEIKLTKKTNESLYKFWQLIHACRNLNNEKGKIAEILMEVLEKSDYLPILRASVDIKDKNRVENLAQLLSIVSEFCNDYPQTNLADYLESVCLVTDLDNLDSAEDKVTLMTIHTSKGLEYPVVFIAGMEEKIFPHELSFHETNGLEEERRLAYVAFTRAEEKLFLSSARQRNIWNKTVYGKQSRFIKDIPSDYCHIEEEILNSFWGDTDSYNDSLKYNNRFYEDYEWKRKIDFDDYNDLFQNKTKIVSGFSNVNNKKHVDSTRKTSIGKIGVPIRNEENKKYDNFEGVKQVSSIEGYDFKIGDKVKHKTFGEGIITGFEEQKVNSTVNVKFKKFGAKRLLLRFNPIAKIDD